MQLRIALVVCPLLAGCYRYAPMNGVEPVAGNSVQVQLTPDGSRELAPLYGPGIQELEGRVAAVDGDSIKLVLRTARSADGLESYFKGDPVTLPRTAVTAILERKLAVGQTALVGGLMVGSAVVGASALGGAFTHGGPPGGGIASPK
jgi:hypothetical protein